MAPLTSTVMMSKVILTVGAPGSGKSTWAKEYCAATGAVQVERDMIRLDHDLPFGTDEGRVTAIHRGYITAYLSKGCDVVVSDLNLSPKNRRSLIQHIGKDAEVWYKLFTDVSRATCLERNNQRPDRVPDHVINDLYDNLIDTNKFNKGIGPQERIMS